MPSRDTGSIAPFQEGEGVRVPLDGTGCAEALLDTEGVAELLQ